MMGRKLLWMWATGPVWFAALLLTLQWIY